MFAGKKKYLAIAVIVLAGILVYWSSLNAPFYLDDNGNIINKDSVRMTELSVNGVAGVLKDSNLASRPVANLSFALNYYFFGYDATLFRSVNITIHIVTAILLLQFLLLTFRSPALKEMYPDATWLAFAAAMLWLVHPVQTQAVTYIVQRMASMSSMFFMASMVCYAAGRLHRYVSGRIVCFAICFFCAMLSLGSKEIAVTLPAFIVLYEWFFFQGCSKQFFKRIVPYVIGGVLLSVLLLYLYNKNFIADYILDGYASRDFSLAERLLTEPRVVLYYLGLLLFPHPSRLSLEHDFVISTSLFSPLSTAGALLVLMLAGTLACIFAKRFPLYSFIVIWFLGNLLLESTVIPLELIFEHRLYLPSMLFFVFIPVVLGQLVPNVWARNCLLVLLVSVLSVWTFQRNMVWADPLAFHMHNIQRAPKNYRSHYNLGHYYLSKAKFTEAIKHLSYALELEPRYMPGHKDLGFSYLMTGEYDKALKEYREALVAFPDDPKMYYYLGVIFRKQGEADRTIPLFSDVLRLAPNHVRAHTNLADLYVAKGEFDKAALHFSEVLRLAGENNFSVLANLGNCYANMGSYDRAILYYTKALRLNPEHERLKQNLDLARQRLRGNR